MIDPSPAEKARRRRAILGRWFGADAGPYLARWQPCDSPGCELPATHAGRGSVRCAAHAEDRSALPALPPDVAAELAALGDLPPAPAAAAETEVVDAPIQWEVGSGAAPDGSPCANPAKNRIIRPIRSAQTVVRPGEVKGPLPPPGRACGNCRWFDREAGRRALFAKVLPDAVLDKMQRYGTLDPMRIGNCGIRPKFWQRVRLRKRVPTLTMDCDPPCAGWEPAGKLVSFTGQRAHG